MSYLFINVVVGYTHSPFNKNNKKNKNKRRTSGTPGYF